MFQSSLSVLTVLALMCAVVAGPADARAERSLGGAEATQAQPMALSAGHLLTDADRVPQVEAPAVDLARVQVEDEVELAQGMAPRFAIPNPAFFTPEANGLWEKGPAGKYVWRLRVSSPGAVSLNLGFTRYVMPEGGRLFVYSTDHEHVVRPFTAGDNASHGELWTPVVPSDDIMIEVTIPYAGRDSLELELTSINVGYREFGQVSSGGLRSGSCNVDVVCPEGDDWRTDISAIAVISSGGSRNCSGFMVNNTSNDRTPFFMTAEHCGVTSGNAASFVAYWNYENTTCRPVGSSGGAGDGPLNMFQTGAYFRATYSASDFTLIELDEDPNPAWEVSFAGWDRSGVDATSAVAIHHPDVEEKRISFEYQPTTVTTYLGETIPGDSTHVRVEDWDLGTTEPGSSGSPLFDQNHRVIGQLHGGYASCTSQTSDWYGRIFTSWTGGNTNA
ncbi:MAG: trypsin-like peptidase domain-containing protein, partial [bacterium]|nr:trypsin-like peptidase domain-containing protein [bacterium]